MSDLGCLRLQEKRSRCSDLSCDRGHTPLNRLIGGQEVGCV